MRGLIFETPRIYISILWSSILVLQKIFDFHCYLFVLKKILRFLHAKHTIGSLNVLHILNSPTVQVLSSQTQFQLNHMLDLKYTHE